MDMPSSSQSLLRTARSAAGRLAHSAAGLGAGVADITGDLRTSSLAITGPGVAVKGRFYPVRTLAAEDTDTLLDFLQNGMSEDSRRLRFMTAMPSVPESAAAWLADRDGESRVALAALDPDDPQRLAAVVEYALLPSGESPEVAFAVADRFQGKGLGSTLLAMLATMSVAAGQPEWSCDVLADNPGPMHILAKVGTVHPGDVVRGVRHVTVELEPTLLFGASAREPTVAVTRWRRRRSGATAP